MGPLTSKLGHGWLVPYFLVGIGILYFVLAGLGVGLTVPVVGLPVSTLLVTVLLTCYGYLLIRAGEQFEQRRLEIWTSRTLTQMFRIVLLVYTAIFAVVVTLRFIGLPSHPVLVVVDTLLPFADISATTGSVAVTNRYAIDALFFVVLTVGLRLGSELNRRLWLLAGGLYDEDTTAETVGIWERYRVWRRNRDS